MRDRVPGWLPEGPARRPAQGQGLVFRVQGFALHISCVRCANMEHESQSRPDSGLSVQAKGLESVFLDGSQKDKLEDQLKVPTSSLY